MRFSIHFYFFWFVRELMKLEMRCTGECNRLPADFHVIVIEDTDATMDAGSIGDIEDGDESSTMKQQLPIATLLIH